MRSKHIHLKQSIYKTTLVALLMFGYHLGFTQNDNGWTIMYYAAGSNSSEIDLMSDIDEMIKGKTSKGYEVITLIDRIEGFSNNATTLGENFTDTKLYRFDKGNYEELSGKEVLPEIRTSNLFEANMGNADVLKRFIKYCKTYYPAKHYMLILRSHGNGRRMCPDIEFGIDDALYTAELSEVLTNDESVDILGLDVCSMAGLENFYQWKPSNNAFSADYILASAPVSAAWDYLNIFNRIQINSKNIYTEELNYFDSGNKQILNPKTMTPLESSKLLIEEIYDSQHWASWGLFDNSKIAKVKLKIDELAKLLALESKEIIYQIIENTLSYHHNIGNDVEVAQLSFPYIDAFDFFQRIAENKTLKQQTKDKAKDICQLIDELTIHSYYGNGFLPISKDFTNGLYGSYLIVPLGNKIFSQSGNSFWSHTNLWFSPNNQKEINNAYGLYNWCSDNAEKGNGKVDNFYEYLNFLFEGSN